jgi:uncharacterized lipoprotein NlpE involved in copper resistance
MKKLLFTLPLLGLVLAGCDKKDSTADATDPTVAQKTESAVKDTANNIADKTKDMAVATKDAIHDKLVDWKLTPDDIKADLAKGGRVVRSKAAAAGASTSAMFDNAKVVTVINAKLVGDAQLSALKINVDADQGVVTLKGTVKSPELIGRAIALALDTDDVTQVVSLLTVEQM